MTTANVLYWFLMMISKVIVSDLKKLVAGKLSRLDFVRNQENREGVFILLDFSSSLLFLSSKFGLALNLSLKMSLKPLQIVSKPLLLHLYKRIENQVKSLLLELSSNTSCQFRERILVSSLNTHSILRKQGSSHKNAPVIFRAREFVLSINSYLYHYKQKRNAAYNSVYAPIGVAVLISL